MIEQQYIDLFTQFREELDAHSVKGLNIHRDAAFEVSGKLVFLLQNRRIIDNLI